MSPKILHEYILRTCSINSTWRSESVKPACTGKNMTTLDRTLNHNSSIYSKNNGVIMSFNYDSFEGFPENVTQNLLWLETCGKIEI